jgi:myo-inositol-1(or 4)-monophosphatase
MKETSNSENATQLDRLQAAETVARKAYDALQDHPSPRQEVPAPEGKIGVLTAADLLIDETIVQQLESEFPRDNVLTEERGYVCNSSESGTWIIDPLDGSKEFKMEIPECGICIGYFDDNCNQFGVVVNPVDGTYISSGSLVAPEWRTTELSEAKISVSRSEVKRGWWDDFGLDVEGVGSIAWKICQVALGQYDATITYTPKNIWDVSAAIAIAEAAGCVVTDGKGEPLKYDIESPLITSGIIVSSPRIADALIEHATPWIANRPSDQMDAR